MDDLPGPAGIAAEDHRLDHDPVDVLPPEAAAVPALAGDQGHVRRGVAGAAQPLHRRGLREFRIGGGMTKRIFGLAPLGPPVLENERVVGDQRQPATRCAASVSRRR